MAIQGTQVPMYTNIHCFCIFFIFQLLLLFLYEKKKTKTEKKKNKNKLNKTKQCIKLDWLKTRKQNTK